VGHDETRDALGRRRAIRELDQRSIDQSFDEHDIPSNCRQYPKDFVFKDGDTADD